MDNAEDSCKASPDAVRRLQLMLTKVLENDGKMLPGQMWHGDDDERCAKHQSLASCFLTFIS